MTLIRYPGSKAKLYKQIVDCIPDQMHGVIWSDQEGWEYREPFFGAGAIGFHVLGNLPCESTVWLNDKDYWLVCLWQTIKSSVGELHERIREYKPNIDDFYAWKEQDGDKSVDPVEAGFRKLALHQMSFSGLGVMAGGPIGGKDQDNAKYPINCRWNADRLIPNSARLSRVLGRFDRWRFSNLDFGKVIEGATSKTFIYLDPPYVVKGPALYQHSMNNDDHARLAGMLKTTRASWVLSYDDCELIRDLYSWANIAVINATYSTATSRNGKRPKNQEVLITP
jgi:DNA adenine methylase